MQNRLIISLIIAKIFFAALTFYFFAVYLGWDMFSYPDYYYAYSNCLEMSPVNIFYSKLFCGVSSIADRPITFDSVFFIAAAAFINMYILIEYFKVCNWNKFLTLQYHLSFFLLIHYKLGARRRKKDFVFVKLYYCLVHLFY
mgnify:CR=1 FL=1